MYEKNIEILKDAVENHRAIRNIKFHRKPDGTFDIEGNLQLWIDCMAPFEKIPLWEEGAPGYDKEKTPLQEDPYMVFVPAEGQAEPRGTIIVAHGGGFSTRTGCEGVNAAWYFHKQGFNTAILTYRLQPYTRFDAIDDMQRAIRLLRYKKDELGITERIACMGFSAGGMLSANCATLYDPGDPQAEDPVERISSRPDAAVLGYGAFVIVAYPGGFFMSPFGDSEEVLRHGGICTENVTRRERLKLSPEANITCDTPPFFIWQTNSDDPRNAFATGYALTMAGVPFELHCFPDGVHGMAMADGENDLAMNIPHVTHWGELCAEWLRAQDI
ncbi:MAG: alpha/beta hydrolase [Lachnospiraceae bacterium]|nr:alpha/beta hydrolase [Lachnospiraceae bacterium]